MISMAVIFFIGTSGCGQKHLSVSTSSGKAHQQEELEASLKDTPSEQTGIQDSSLSETGLGSELASQGSMEQETAMLVEQPPLPTIRGESAEESLETTGSREGIQHPTNSGAEEDLPNPSAYQTAMEPGFDPFGSAETDQGALMDSPHVERVPEHIVVAKVEPSDAMEEQLARIQEDELATAAAGLQDIFFEFDSWKITEEGKDMLDKNANLLQEDPDTNLLIEGHCDQRGTQAYNIVLGKKRAIAIRDYLVNLGVEPTRLSVITYGKEKPFCTDQTEFCYKENRRGHLIVQ
jgi:peptidoglycan-associated lipoprotein